MPLVHTTAVALALGGAVLFGTGSAAADIDMNGALMNSTCSFAQVDKALHAEAPDVAAKFDAQPDKKAHIQQVFDQPIEQRKAAINKYMADHPDRVAEWRQHEAADPAKAARMKALMDQLAQNCHKY